MTREEIIAQLKVLEELDRLVKPELREAWEEVKDIVMARLHEAMPDFVPDPEEIPF